MIRLLRRMSIMGMVLVMCVSCFSPIALAASIENSDDSSVIQVELDDYISSREYYRTLLLEGYTLIVHVGEEREEDGLEEFTLCDDTMNLETADDQESLVEDIMPYGDGIPTREWNVAKQGTRSIEGSRRDTLGYLFTNYIFVGCSTYEVDLYNRGTSTLKADVGKKGSTKAFSSLSVPAQSAAVKLVMQPSWYARFKLPCDVSGKVFKYVMH